MSRFLDFLPATQHTNLTKSQNNRGVFSTLAKITRSRNLPSIMSVYLPTVPHKRNIEYFKKQLAENPALRRPEVLSELDWSMSEQSWEWKSALRSYDAARIEMQIRTPMEVQRENSWLPPGCTPRLVEWHFNRKRKRAHA